MAKQKAKNRAKKTELPGSRVRLRFSKHFLPPLVGLLVALLVLGFFNSGLISGKIAYWLYKNQVNVAEMDIIAAGSFINKNAPPQVIINKINVKAPVIYDQTTVDEKAFQKALQRGVVHYPNTAKPGKQGNVVIFGHSSGQWWAPGDYKFVFTLLDKVKNGDKIFMDYDGTRYIYEVTNNFVVPPTDISVLNQGGSYTLTVITCTPVGTSTNRLIVQARQISPKPGASVAYNEAATLPNEVQKALPSSAPSFWDNFLELFR